MHTRVSAPADAGHVHTDVAGPQVGHPGAAHSILDDAGDPGQLVERPDGECAVQPCLVSPGEVGHPKFNVVPTARKHEYGQDNKRN